MEFTVRAGVEPGRLPRLSFVRVHRRRWWSEMQPWGLFVEWTVREGDEAVGRW